MNKALSIYIDPKVHARVRAWAAYAGGLGQEFLCFARVEEIDESPVITGAWLVKQEGGVADVQPDLRDYARLQAELVGAGIPLGELKCWIHSHPGRGEKATYLSGIDEATIERFMDRQNGSFLVSIVLDSAGESPFCRVDVTRPYRASIPANLIVLPILSAEELKAARAEMKAMIVERPKPELKLSSKWGGTIIPRKGAAGKDTPAFDASKFSILPAEWNEWDDAFGDEADKWLNDSYLPTGMK